MEPYDVYALRYAHAERPARDNFIFDPIHQGPMPLDFFIWAIVGNGRVFVVDLGFDHAGAARRGRDILRLPSESLEMLGIRAADVENVIVTHMHYDHAGDLSAFKNARLYVQDREMAYATGRHMANERLRLAFDVDYVCAFVRAVYDERVVFVDGVKELAPGIEVHHIGGHTDGHQETQNPFPIVHNVSDMVEGYKRLSELADDDGLIIPGHDPLVIERFPCPDPSFHGEIVQLS
jgi:glyoxylase-like metal-dependent hydrolase (beta-lactamase superfamily II)